MTESKSVLRRRAIQHGCDDPTCEIDHDALAHLEGIYEGVAVENANGIDGLS